MSKDRRSRIRELVAEVAFLSGRIAGICIQLEAELPSLTEAMESLVRPSRSTLGPISRSVRAAERELGDIAKKVVEGGLEPGARARAIIESREKSGLTGLQRQVLHLLHHFHPRGLTRFQLDNLVRDAGRLHDGALVPLMHRALLGHGLPSGRIVLAPAGLELMASEQIVRPSTPAQPYLACSIGSRRRLLEKLIEAGSSWTDRGELARHVRLSEKGASFNNQLRELSGVSLLDFRGQSVRLSQEALAWPR